MTASDHRKVLKQIQSKPAKYARWQKHNNPKERKFGMASKKCIRCNRAGGHISKYGLNFCRQCFREIATKLGFKKYN